NSSSVSDGLASSARAKGAGMSNSTKSPKVRFRLEIVRGFMALFRLRGARVELRIAKQTHRVPASEQPGSVNCSAGEGAPNILTLSGTSEQPSPTRAFSRPLARIARQQPSDRYGFARNVVAPNSWVASAVSATRCRQARVVARIRGASGR